MSESLLLFAGRTYSDPAQASDPYYLATIVLTSQDGKSWSVHEAMPGCLPDGDEMTFHTPMEAMAYAWESADPMWCRLFRSAYFAAFCRLKGNIETAQMHESMVDAWIVEHGESEGQQEIEEFAQEIAAAMDSVKS